MLGEQRIEDINHQVVLVVDDVWNSQDGASSHILRVNCGDC